MPKWGQITCGGKVATDPAEAFTRTYIRDNCPQHVRDLVVALDAEIERLKEKCGEKEG